MAGLTCLLLSGCASLSSGDGGVDTNTDLPATGPAGEAPIVVADVQNEAESVDSDADLRRALRERIAGLRERLQSLENPAIDLPDPGGRPDRSTRGNRTVPGAPGDLPVSAGEASASAESTADSGPSRSVGAPGVSADVSASTRSPGAVTERVREERRQAFNPYVITAHRNNFMLPVAYTSDLNESVYRENDIPLREGLKPVEVKFQISLKTQLNDKDLWLKDDNLSLGITLEAWWQLYSSDLSSPFRETNYSPEIFYLKPLLWGPFGGSTAVAVGLIHQSNGQVQGLSRSWNRLYANFLYERGNLVLSVRPWYRLPEKDKESPDDPEGDDNPDILDFMGHAEIGIGWRDRMNEYQLRVRGNPATGKGSAIVSASFPLFGKFRGLVQYFNGYGDALIDYDHFQQRLGLGVSLTNLF